MNMWVPLKEKEKKKKIKSKLKGENGSEGRGREWKMFLIFYLLVSFSDLQKI